MERLYFASKNDETCHSLNYFRGMMEYQGWPEMELFAAVQVPASDVSYFFWCKHFELVGEKGECGKLCSSYTPKNGKTGCCMHYSKKLYEASDEVFILKKMNQ